MASDAKAAWDVSRRVSQAVDEPGGISRRPLQRVARAGRTQLRDRCVAPSRGSPRGDRAGCRAVLEARTDAIALSKIDVTTCGTRWNGCRAKIANSLRWASFYTMIWRHYAAGRPNPQLDIHQTITQGDVLACRFAMSGVHQGTFMGAHATGRAYVLGGHDDSLP